MADKSVFDHLIDYSCNHEWVFWVAEAIPVALFCGLIGWLVASTT